MTPSEISAMLANQVETVAGYLLPSGKRIGSHWCAGSVHGEEGKSLKVALNGTKAGRWADYADDQYHGDLIDLWAATQALELREAIQAAKKYLGIQETNIRPAYTNRKAAAAPKPQQGVTSLSEFSAVYAYLTQERKLTPEILQKFKVAELDGKTIVFPYLGENGKRILIKYLAVERKEGKKIWTSQDSAKTLYGWHALDHNSRYVVLTEGEIDCMTLAQHGIPALSIPYGAGKQGQAEWIENDYDLLQRFDEIIVWMDNDEAGKTTAKEIAERLGRERCRIATASYNDPNEMLQKGCTDFQKTIDAAKTLQHPTIRSAGDYVDDVIAEFYPVDGIEPGFSLGWQGMEWLRFRPAELIVISGYNGSGKSQFAGQIMLEAMRFGCRSCVASLEMPVGRVLMRMTKQASARGDPSIPYIHEIRGWFSENLWVYDHVGRLSVDDLLDGFDYARKRFGVEVFLIDSLMMLGVATDDYQSQKDLVQRLMEWKMHNGATVFLVAHSRKQGSEEHRPSKLDVRGAGEITDMADTVLLIWRDKREDRKFDAHISCGKQRNGDKEGDYFAWFDGPSNQFIQNKFVGPSRFVNYQKPRSAA